MDALPFSIEMAVFSIFNRNSPFLGLKKLTFQEEYLKFLREYGVSFNKNYLWE
jgi:hypothetical protein